MPSEAAMNACDFSGGLLQAADLVDTLSGPGPFTVFAPTNDAFAKIDAATLESLAKPENKDQLTAILTRVRRVEDSNSCRSP